MAGAEFDISDGCSGIYEAGFFNPVTLGVVALTLKAILQLLQIEGGK